MSELTTTEIYELAEHERVIEQGLQTFVEVGSALLAIREKRLYRQLFDTFEDYCRERWGMSRRHANRTIAAAEVAGHLGPIGPIPTSEYQVRPLTNVEPELRNEVWQRAVETSENGKPTGAHVQQVVDEYRQSSAPAHKTTDGAENMAVHYSSESDEWETPQPLFDLLDREFGFDLDVCALSGNAKCERFFTPESDGLSQEWTGVCWMNPPYGDEISHWVAKAFEEAQRGATVVCLVPARTDTRWWWDYCIEGEVRFIKGRLRFSNASSGAPFPSAVVIFRPFGIYGGNVVWWHEGSHV